MGLERINEIRKQRGMTIEELSERSGIPVSTLKKISAGITTNPSLDTVKAIARALDCTLDDLADDSRPRILAAAAHFDLDKLTPEGREQYERYIEFLAEKYSKEKSGK